MLYKPGKRWTVHCRLCSHLCHIRNGDDGFCGVRYNSGGRLYTRVYGRALACNVDPIEKKPLYHFLPGSRIFSVGAPGCNFRCDYCQNWQISQVGEGAPAHVGPDLLAPDDLVASAISRRCRGIAYTYTEPTIFFEYAFETARLARQAGLANVFVTNGYMTAQAIETIAPYLDAANVDLKAWRDGFYRDLCQARAKPVRDTIHRMKRLGIWVEVTTLVIPGENDSREELEAMAAFIAEVDPDIPWHLSRFHPQYRMRDHQMTPFETLERAAEIADAKGLRFVYLGNVPDGRRITRCPACGNDLMRRTMTEVDTSGLADGRCRSCRALIPGVWKREPQNDTDIVLPD